MTSVLLWKVYREQQLVWLAMASLAAALMLAVRVLAPEVNPYSLSALSCSLAYIYGLVVGAMLLAGERESGTAVFLEALPASRLAVWGGKCLGGSLFVLAEVFWLWLFQTAVYPPPNTNVFLVLLVTLAGWAALGFAWGLLFSGRTQTALGAAFGALVGQAVAILGMICLWPLRLWQVFFYESPGNNEVGSLTVMGSLLLVVPVALSGIRQVRLDRQHRLLPGQAVLGLDYWSFRAAFRWLVGNFARMPFRSLALVALAAGIVLPVDYGDWLWLIPGFLLEVCFPLLALLVGAVAGVSAFASVGRDQGLGHRGEGEAPAEPEGAGSAGASASLSGQIHDHRPSGQRGHSARFTGSSVWSANRLWAVQIVKHLALACGIVLLLLIPATIRSAIGARTDEPALPGDSDHASWMLDLIPYLTLCLMHGFGVGCLCGMVFRGGKIAAVVAFGVSLVLVILWVPSLFAGGLHLWQMWGAPIILLITSRVLLVPWATARLGSLGAILKLACGLVLAGLWMAGAIAYRYAEIALAEDRLDLAGFERKLAADRDNEAGPLVRSALEQIGQVEISTNLQRQLNRVRFLGWPPGKPELAGWLDEVFQQPWPAQLEAVTTMPLAVIATDSNDFFFFMDGGKYKYKLVAGLLVARGLQLQARGDPAAFVKLLAAGLALVRQGRHGAPTALSKHAWAAEIILLQGVDRWLARQDQRPDLLRQVLALLVAHSRAGLNDKDDLLRADYLLALKRVSQSGNSFFLHPRHRSGPDPLSWMAMLAWQPQWEQDRLERIVRQQAFNWDRSLPVPEPLRGFPFSELITENSPFHKHEPVDYSFVAAHELLLALCIHRAEKGQPAKTLQELTPTILDTLPVDPATGKPFDYWLSRGEYVCVGMVHFPVEGGYLELADIVRPYGWLEPEDLDFDLPWALAGQGILTTLDCTFLVPVPFADSINLAVNTWSLIVRCRQLIAPGPGPYLLGVAELAIPAHALPAGKEPKP